MSRPGCHGHETQQTLTIRGTYVCTYCSAVKLANRAIAPRRRMYEYTRPLVCRTRLIRALTCCCCWLETPAPPPSPGPTSCPELRGIDALLPSIPPGLSPQGQPPPQAAARATDTTGDKARQRQSRQACIWDTTVSNNNTAPKPSFGVYCR